MTISTVQSHDSKNTSTSCKAGEHHALSYSQQAMLAATELHPNSPAYNIVRLLQVNGTFDPQRLNETLARLIQRHEILRTGFGWIGNEAQQIVASSSAPDFNVHDLNGRDDPCDIARRDAEHEAAKPFAVNQAPLFRCRVWKISENEHWVLLVWHHIIFDNHSTGFFLDELFQTYREGADVLEHAKVPQYHEFVTWQARENKSSRLKEQFAFWQKYLAGSADSPTLPFDFPVSSMSDQQGDMERWTLDGKTWCLLKAYAEHRDCSMFDCLGAALGVLLFRYSGQGDFCLGSMSNGRVAPEFSSGIGLFFNNVVLRQSIDGKTPMSKILEQVRDSNNRAFVHRDYPYDMLVRELYRRRRGGENPWFEVLIDLHEGEFNSSDAARLGGGDYKVEALDLPVRATKYLLSFDFFVQDAALELQLSYNSGVFLAETIRWMGAHLLALIEHLVDPSADADRTPVDALPIFDDAHRRIVLSEWNDTEVSHPVRLLHTGFEQTADRYPTSIAVRQADYNISYADLDARANQLARVLLARGINRNKLVGVCAHRSVQRMIALLGILKAGGAFLPLDPEDPEQRLEGMIDDAEPYLILAEGQLLENTDVPRLCLDNVHVDNGESTQRPDIEVQPTDLAYLIYTSGSTGKPKGVMISHQAIDNQIAWMSREHPLSTRDRVLQKTPYSFDVSIWELFWPLADGACLVLAKPGGHRDPEYLLNIIEREQITVIHFVPSMLREFLAAYNVTPRCRSLRAIFCTGEALYTELAETCYQLIPVPLYNLYGPTEAAVHATSWRFEPEDAASATVPIGKPLDNTRAYILDKNMQLTPVGAVGELWLGGIGLADGYWQRRGLTAAAFRPDPVSGLPGERLYKTGDLVRYRPDGVIEYLSRVDSQIKLRGQRIELGEVEACLTKHPEVQGAACAVVEPTNHDQRLVAWYTGSETLEQRTLKNWLRQQLPPAWIPNVFVHIDHLPVTENGKLDRESLPDPNFDQTAEPKNFVAPTTELEIQLAQVWSEILAVDKIGLHDNFFDLGGHSLLGVRLIHKIEDTLDLELPVSALQEIATLADMAQSIEQSINTQTAPDSPNGSDHRLFNSQEYRLMLAAAASSTLPSLGAGSLLLKLNESGSKPPLFWCFNAPRREMPKLAALLGDDQPIYGMFSGGRILEPQTEVNTCWVIDKYVDELTRLDLEQPFVIGGNCRGASVACGIALAMADLGSPAHKLCLLEHFDPRLFGYSGQMLLLFGRESHLQEHKKFHWGSIGWREPFKRVPDIAIIPGRHGFFFTDVNVKTLAENVKNFLDS